jgi:hypothetical protein
MRHTAPMAMPTIAPVPSFELELDDVLDEPVAGALLTVIRLTDPD